jgi:hypothetical protein
MILAADINIIIQLLVNYKHNRMEAAYMKLLFTLAEANALIPSVRSDIEKLQGIKQKYRAKYDELQLLKAYFRKHQPPEGRDPFFTLECEMDFLQLEGSTVIKNFELKGVQLKDIDSGLVDFPAILDGHHILLCWKQGEDSITHYHGVDEGFAGRRKLSEEQSG